MTRIKKNFGDDQNTDISISADGDYREMKKKDTPSKRQVLAGVLVLHYTSQTHVFRMPRQYLVEQNQEKRRRQLIKTNYGHGRTGEEKKGAA